jgi:hypothetical protein
MFVAVESRTRASARRACSGVGSGSAVQPGPWAYRRSAARRSEGTCVVLVLGPERNRPAVRRQQG